jgi:membrane protease YdiL (CAAX protease family)
LNYNLFEDKRLNYKDFLIILISWYFIILGNYFLKELKFSHLIYFNNLLSFIFNVLGHTIFFMIIYGYFNYLYNFSFEELSIKLNKENILFVLTASLILLLSLGVIIINLNADKAGDSFNPLYNILNFAEVMNALPFLIVIFSTSILTALAELFLFNKIIFAIFELYFPKFLASFLTALFAPVLILQFNAAFMLIIFLSVLISNILYIISDYNLASSVIFYASFITLYTAFIYGFNFMII